MPDYIQATHVRSTYDATPGGTMPRASTESAFRFPMEFRAPDGTQWIVHVRSPSASHAMVVFTHPSNATHRIDRYAWYQYGGPEARDVSGRLSPRQIMDALTADDVSHLFRVSMPITTHRAMERGFTGVDPAALMGQAGATAPDGTALATTGVRNQGLAGLFSRDNDSGSGIAG